MRSQKQRGISLVELLIATALGLFLLAGVFSIYLSNKKTYHYNEALARIQENARVAFLRLNHDVRMAKEITISDKKDELLIKTIDPDTVLDTKEDHLITLNYHVAKTTRKNKAGNAIFALYRRDASKPNLPSELVEGTEKMTVTAIKNGAVITGVRIALLLDSIEAVNDQPQPYTYLDKTYTPNDKRARREWDTVIALREHLP
jgi:Tfp pilus assembly protein PilW